MKYKNAQFRKCKTNSYLTIECYLFKKSIYPHLIFVFYTKQKDQRDYRPKILLSCSNNKFSQLCMILYVQSCANIW